MTDKTSPERIWLNTAGSYADAHEAYLHTETGVTWCDIPQDDDDQEYVRADRIEALEAENARLWEALTPSVGTKTAYMGEFTMQFPLRDEGGEYMRSINVPWTTIKEIMAAIRARAAKEGDDA